MTNARVAEPRRGKTDAPGRGGSQILRLFPVASFVGIVTAAVLLTFLYRQVAIRDIISFGERSNVVLAQGFLNAVRAPLVPYLADEDHHHGRPVPAELVDAINGLLHNTGVIRAKIYDDEGIVLHSTKAQQIGENRSDNPGFQAAIAGRVASKLIYRDSFNPFDRATESDNLIQSYVPVRRSRTEPVLGVFEIYTDVNHLVAEIERGQLLVLGGGMAILALLYLALVAVVRHADRLIAAQQNTIRERSHTLELLSAQLISAQENEKQRVAGELHEGVAQTLSAVKFQVERACALAGSQSGAGGPALEAVVPALQGAIQEVRALAMELRPSSLDDLGLLSTLGWYLRELRAVYPGLDVRQDLSVREEAISKPLKVVIYRVVQLALHYVARDAGARRAHVRLYPADAAVRLEVTHDGPSGARQAGPEADSDLQLLVLRERVTLSGGALTVGADGARGCSTLTASWPV
jgi:signal transduction histidine kinase